MEMLLERWDSDAVVVVQGAADVMSWILLAQFGLFLALALLVRNTMVVRRFWCAVAHRDVEVMFERPPLALPPGRLAVRRCSACEPASAISCDRHCVEADHRLPCAPPVLDWSGSRAAPGSSAVARELLGGARAHPPDGAGEGQLHGA